MELAPLTTAEEKNTVVFVGAPPLNSDAFANGPYACTGASTFLCIMFWWCLITLIVPIVILLPIYLLVEVANSTILIILCVLVGVGVAVCCFSIRALLVGIICKAPLPAPTKPFKNAKGIQTRPVKKLVLIVNPHGGGKRGLVTLEKVILPIWEGEYKLTVEVLRTTRAGHAVELGRTVDLTGVDGLCILGGDGSFHELVNGFLQRNPVPDVAIGLLPGGTGNSLMKDLGTWDVAEACRRIAKGLTAPMDANLVILPNNRIVSINEISWGLVGDVAVLSEGWRWIGAVRYDLCALWGLFKAQRRLCDLIIDGGEKMTADFATFFVNNTQYFGKNLRACPDAVLDDGLMNVVYFLDATRGEKLLVFLQLPEGRHKKHKDVTFKEAKNIKFTPKEGSGVLNIDGENYPYEGTIEVQILPGAFRMFIAPELVES